MPAKQLTIACSCGRVQNLTGRARLSAIQVLVADDPARAETIDQDGHQEDVRWCGLGCRNPAAREMIGALKKKTRGLRLEEAEP